MTKEEIIEKVNAFLVDEYEKEAQQLVETARLREDLDLNSLDYVDLIVTTNRTFNTRFMAAEFNQIITLSDFYDFLYKRLNESAEE